MDKDESNIGSDDRSEIDKLREEMGFLVQRIIHIEEYLMRTTENSSLGPSDWTMKN